MTNSICNNRFLTHFLESADPKLKITAITMVFLVILSLFLIIGGSLGIIPLVPAIIVGSILTVLITTVTITLLLANFKTTKKSTIETQTEEVDKATIETQTEEADKATAETQTEEVDKATAETQTEEVDKATAETQTEEADAPVSNLGILQFLLHIARGH